MSQTEHEANPYLPGESRDVVKDSGKSFGRYVRLLIPPSLLVLNLLPLVGTANGWITRAKSYWFVLMGLAWLVFTPFVYLIVRPLSTSFGRLVGVFWSILFVLLGIAFNVWAVLVIESR